MASALIHGNVCACVRTRACVAVWGGGRLIKDCVSGII